MPYSYFLDAALEVKEITEAEYKHCIECLLQDNIEFDVDSDGKRSIIIVPYNPVR